MGQTKSKEKKGGSAKLSRRADRYALYLASVQEPDAEVSFFDRAYRNEFGDKPMRLREDFCGAAAVCRSWVQSDAAREAVGVDLDPEPLTWGLEHLLGELGPEQFDRLALVEGDARRPHADRGGTGVDVLAAQNFSFWLFKTREELRDYFASAREHLAERGIMVLDMMGGGDCYIEGNEDVRHVDGSRIPLLRDWAHPGGKRIKGRTSTFEYVWEQHCFNPITADATFFIHFRLPDGSSMKRAFRYDWRFWTIPEVRELLLEAGFDAVHVYWEGSTADGEGDGVFRKRAKAPSDPSWIAYMVAVKGG